MYSLFENNTSVERSTGRTADTSALAAFRFPTRFNGTNKFINNYGGGIMLLNTRLQALDNLLFMNNQAVFGGGIMMDDRCLVSYLLNHSYILYSNSLKSLLILT